MRDPYERPSKWETVEWRMPNGRTVWAIDEPVMVDIGISDGTVRHYPLALPEGLHVAWVSVSGDRWVRRGMKDFDNIESAEGIDG